MAVCIIFDNNESMEVKEECHSFTSLDMAKAGMEAFLAMSLKLQTPAQSFMLLESGQDKSCIRSSIGDPRHVLEHEMKNFASLASPNHDALMTEDEDKITTIVQDIVSPSGESSSSESISTSMSYSTDFSYSVSLAFSILNKYRVKNGSDRFGHGRSPWILEPATLLIFTNEHAQLDKQFVLGKGRGGTLSEYVSDAYRWDHRVFVFVMCSSGMDKVDTALSCDIPSSLADIASLCAATGGEISVCRSLREAQNSLRNVAIKLHASMLSVAARFSCVTGDESTGSVTGGASIAGKEILARIHVKTTGEWPIPEQDWIDAKTEQLPVRGSVPLFTILRHGSGIQAHQSPHSTKALLQIAKEIDIRADIYEVSGNLSRLLGTGKTKDEYYPVCITSQVIPNHVVGTSVSSGSINSSSSRPEPVCVPFAILCPNRSPSGQVSHASGSWQLVVLPYNYPKCLSLLKGAADQLRGAHQAPTPSHLQSFWNELRDDWKKYVESIPGYYYQPLSHVLRRGPLKPLLQGPLSGIGEFKLHRQPIRRIQRAQVMACSDIDAVEAVAKVKWPKVSASPIEVCLANSAHRRQLLPLVSRLSIPQAVVHMHHSEILPVWEMMRQAVFGGGEGVTAGCFNGLCVSRGDEHSSKKRLPDNDWLMRSCGSSSAPAENLEKMQLYGLAIARQECLRDPDMPVCKDEEDLLVDEDTDVGILKRKLHSINFGSRFGGGKRAAGMKDARESVATNVPHPDSTDDVFDIEGIMNSSNLGRVPCGAGEDIVLKGGTTPSSLSYSSGPIRQGVENSLQIEIHPLFADTPAPHRMDENVEEGFGDENYVGFKNDVIDVYSHVDGDGMLRERPSALEPSRTSFQTNEIGILKPLGAVGPGYTLPKLGKPLSRPPRHPSRRLRSDKTVGHDDGMVSLSSAPSLDSDQGQGIAVNQISTYLQTQTGLQTYSDVRSGTDTANVLALKRDRCGAGGGSTGDTSRESDSDSNDEKCSLFSATPISTSTTASPASADTPSTPTTWVVHFSAKHNRNYWFSPSTGKSVWDDPTKCNNK